MTYYSPVDITTSTNRIISEVNKQTDETIIRAVLDVGINVEKEELIKALEYDRNQYSQGYDDGYADGYNKGKSDMLKAIKDLG